MSTDTKVRDLLVFARLELLDAELAVSVGDVRNAHIRLDLAQAYIEECRKALPPVASYPLPATRYSLPS